MKHQIMSFSTPYGDTYNVDLTTGYIRKRGTTFSKGWEFIGFMRVNHSRLFVDITLDQIRKDPAILQSIQWLYKNGHPRYTVVDRDYGTLRAWGNTHIHAVRYIWLEG